ncbi:phage/plasmid replication domain-containing protein [Mucilaginibacter sp.]
MIDTINFRLKNVSSYPTIKNQYERTTQTGRTDMYINEDTGEITGSNKIRAILHHDSDNIMPLSKRDSLFIASSHYSVSYHYVIAKDLIDFNFAIPKYLYGTNILQFIQYYDQTPQTIYKQLISFVKTFCKKHFSDPVKMTDIEITRLDFCYNQFFPSQYDALNYLEEQKELLTKYARSSTNKYKSWDTSFMYVTGRYSFKVYHKGTEFKRNDRKELQKKNPTGENLDHLQSMADRILRYEVTFRKSQFDYLFRQHDLHKDYIPHNDAYFKVLAKTDKAYLQKNMDFINRGKTYVLKDNNLDHVLNTREVVFTYKLFHLLYEFFWQKVKDYQLKVKYSVTDVIKKVDALNDLRDKITLDRKELRRKNSFNKPMIVTLTLLSQYYSLDELGKSGLLPRSTFYHYKDKLKQVGVDSESRLSDMPPPALDYQQYKFYFGRHHLK